MRRVVSLTVIFVLGAVFAQGRLLPDEAIEVHVSALENLQLSVERLAGGSEGSEAALAAAAAGFRDLERGANPVLVGGMERAFESARTAVANQSTVDLAVQTAVLAGGFQRLLLDSALADADSAAVRSVIGRLAADVGLGVNDLNAIQESDSVPAMLARYRAAVAATAAARLRQAAEQAEAEGTDAAYRTFASAYGLSLSLQDAEGAPADLNERFSALIEPVTASDPEGFSAAAEELAADLSRLETALSGTEAREQDSPPAEEDSSDGAAETDGAAAEPAPAPEAAADREEEGGETPPEPETETAEAEETDAAAPAAEAGNPDGDGTEAAAEAAAEEQPEETAGPSAAEVWGRALELGTRAAAAADAGDQTEAFRHLDELALLQRTDLVPFSAAELPGRDRAAGDLLAALQDLPVVHGSDIRVLNAELVELADGVQLRPAAAEVQALTVTWTGGWPRLALRIITGLLAFLPLWYLKLAFGGSNRNWSLVSSGLFLLLLPVILSGAGAALELVGSVTGLSVLQQAAAWLVPAGALQETVRLILTVLAVLFLSFGLLGICRQFGLFGGSRTRTTTVSADAAGTDGTLGDWEAEL